ncbi:response regulator [Trichocoleus sp. FACHB-591]|uniref:response regulator transcription factor n=1 Tax=Trichocoleus sp. FACHB-591 TaxID=2692872 RepID=UPI0016889634|nr:response regulator [Trichocoleus sp. FACHB-591]MBD2097191.1 response regulator [Trichocoleus sp. FACHB-591]
MPSSSSDSIHTVLVVDDSAVIRDLIQTALSPKYRVLALSNAVDALAAIYHEQISILLLDVLMPEIDGLELCRTIRNLPQFHQLPIIMITAKDSLFDKVQGRLAGATEYLTKPFNACQLLQTIERLIEVDSLKN